MRAGSLHLDGAVFDRGSGLKVAAASISCRGATWRGGAAIRLRYAEVDLERATFGAPSSVAGSDQPFAIGDRRLDEERVRGRVSEERGESDDLWMPVLTSLREADAANLAVTDVDLSACSFAGAHVLDQIRLEGRCIFDHQPRGSRLGWAWPPVWLWSSRQTLAEERTWRATTRKYAGWADKRSEAAQVGPERLAALYRQLRKAQEDAKNEPGAADFYYGEMEMRRHSRHTSWAERVILTVLGDLRVRAARDSRIHDARRTDLRVRGGA